ncbi:diacylglycerol kinase [Paraherbaspirillum soli]|uniref:Diacylglycerol kinase n=1 Tax=Paraherbaspirillum soli TaxID=631222 RepID=A0ABW0MAX2_9BURK
MSKRNQPRQSQQPPSQSQQAPQRISEFKSTSGFKRIFSAFFYSIEGFKSAWKNEHAFRQELAIVIPGIIVALFLPVSLLQKLMLIAVLVWIIIIELINSAIEAVVDRVSLERNPLSKNAKDFGSAAVLLTFMLAVATWAVILFPLFKS